MKPFHIFLSLTRNCNFRCKYCYEKDQYKNSLLSLDSCEKIFNFIENVKASDFFRSRKFNNVFITFFGGEPTLNENALKYFTEKYKNDDTIFAIITNGSKENVIRNVFGDIYKYRVYNKNKVFVQISYDGIPIHDQSRLDINGNPTSHLVKKTIINLLKDNYPVSIKSTLEPDNFQYMYDSYKDIRNFFKEPNGSYFPTIDYYNKYENNYKIENLKESLIKISADEIAYYKKYKKFFFKWFNNNSNKTCSAGHGMIAIDSDLNIYPCHGAFFEDSKDHLIGNIYDKNIITKIENTYNIFKLNMYKSSCNNCDNTICYKCNIIKYKYSDKNSYFDRWFDLKDQPWLCSYYNVANKIKKAVYKLL